MSEGEFVFVYSTFPDRESAERVARRLVEEKLAACVNMLAPMTSVYEWEGKIDLTTEHAVLIKTRRVLANEVISEARLLHPYTVPCFLTLPIHSGNDDYFAWAHGQMSEP